MSLEEAWELYRAASRDYERLVTCAPSEQWVDPNGPLARAWKDEAKALAGYLQVLRDLSQLAPQGKLLDGNHVEFNRDYR